MNVEKNITFVVPVHGQSGLYLSRCLNSILDNQDYPYKDAIVVFDGDDQMKGALKQEEYFKDDDRVQMFHVEHGGAPKARNFGLSKAKGDYVCFYDCDCALQAGGIRTWIQAFDDHPDCGFVYGPYRYFVKEQYNMGIPSKDFDPWELTCNNYISSMNPIKRELCPKWDETLEGLQDWDFWLKVAGAGIKGHKLNEWLTLTEPPTIDSISGKTHVDWIAKKMAVQRANDIPIRDIAITSIGAPFQSKRRAKILGADYQDPEMLTLKPHEYKGIICMGYYVESSVHPYTIFQQANGAKKIIHWIGTDVMQLSLKKFVEVKVLREWLPKAVDRMFVNAPWLKAEMAEMGIETELLYCPIESEPYKITPFPEEFTLAVYRSETNPMHNELFMLDVAKSCPDIKWKFFGGDRPHTLLGVPHNVEILGTIPENEVPKLIESTSAIVRVTVHDGFPASVAEWVMGGRPFISNLPDMPFNRHVAVKPDEKNYIMCKERVIKKIRNLQRNMGKITMKEQETARKYYVDLLSPETYRKRIAEVVHG